MQAARHPAFTRFNVFLRDRFTCQYCGEPYPVARSDLRPSSSRARAAADDLVQCRHGLLHLQSVQGQPPAARERHVSAPPARSSRRRYMLQENGRAFPPNYLHESWRDYLYWDTELEQS